MGLYNSYGIYGIVNKTNDKIYVGKTMKSFGDRWDCHKAELRGGYHENKHLQNAWNKYGEENFDFTIIHNCQNNEDLDRVNELEIQEIKKYKQLGLAYNIHDGGDGGMFLGKHLSEETKRKIGEKNRMHMMGRKLPLEVRHKMSESQRKRFATWTDEDRRLWGIKMSKSSTGIKKPILKEKMKNNKNGAKYTIDQVNEIRRLHESENKTYTEISNIMNIPRPTVYLIATYRRWKTIS